jgi:hypothetical protein
MAPQITDIKELQFKLRLSDGLLRVRQFQVQTASDFIATQGSSKQDVAFFSEGTGGGIGVEAFYSSDTLKSFQLGDNLFITGAAGQEVAIVHLTD